MTLEDFNQIAPVLKIEFDDFWNEHIKYVYDKALVLAKKYDADIEIVSLGALLHDIALIKKVQSLRNYSENYQHGVKSILYLLIRLPPLLHLRKIWEVW